MRSELTDEERFTILGDATKQEEMIRHFGKVKFAISDERFRHAIVTMLVFREPRIQLCYTSPTFAIFCERGFKQVFVDELDTLSKVRYAVGPYGPVMLINTSTGHNLLVFFQPDVKNLY